MQYTLMHKTKPVLRMEIDESAGTISAVTATLAPEHLPVGIPCAGDVVDRKVLNDWWAGRAIPASRDGLRDALEALGVSSPQMLLTRCYGLSLSDQYWVCPDDPPQKACGLSGDPGGSGLRWEDINFFDHPFSEDVGNILFGREPGDEAVSLLSPDNTSDGQLRKKWTIMEGRRCLMKGGSNPFQQEPLNEVIASAAMRRLGVDHTPYSLIWMDEMPYSVCEDFITQQTELVSAWHIMQTQKRENHVSKLQHYLNCCDALGIPGVRESVDRMLAVDFIIANEDRHFNNFGAVRDAETLAWVSPAPIFDCGTSLWFNRLIGKPSPYQPAPSKPFRGDHAEQIKLVTSLKWLDFNALHGIDEEFGELLRGSPFIEPARRDALCYGLRGRVEALEGIARARQRQRGQER